MSRRPRALSATCRSSPRRPCCAPGAAPRRRAAADSRNLQDASSTAAAPMYVRRPEARARAVRPAPVPALRPGRSADDDHRPVASATTRTRARRATSSGWRASASRAPASRCASSTRTDATCRRARSARSITRSDCVMARLLEQSGGDRRGAARRLAAHRRHRLPRRATGSSRCKDRSKDMIISRRLQHLSARDRGSAAARTRRVLEASVVGRPHADWGEEVVAFVVAQPGRRLRPTSARPALPRQHRALQAAAAATASSTRCRRTTTARC